MGVDSRILVAQVPGGMLTNMESQLKEQGAADKIDEVLEEIPRVREDLGFLPLVTPTSQIVGTQSVINVLTGERYKSITRETAGVLKGEYGATPCTGEQRAAGSAFWKAVKPLPAARRISCSRSLQALTERVTQAWPKRKTIRLTAGDQVRSTMY